MDFASLDVSMLDVNGLGENISGKDVWVAARGSDAIIFPNV